MIASIRYCGGPLSGHVRLPASKSISNRYLVLRSLLGVSTTIENLSEARDTQLLRRLLESSGNVLDAEDAGTVCRFLTACLAYRRGTWALTGSERMQQRPIGVLVDALRRLGARIEYSGREGFPPLLIEGGFLRGGEVSLDGSVSSQFITALLLVGPFLPGGIVVHLEGTPVSAPYITMTLALLRNCRVKVEFEGTTIRVEHCTPCLDNLSVEPDWSSAAFFFGAASLASSADLTLEGLRDESIQGDARLTALASTFGLEGRFVEAGWSLRTGGELPVAVDLDLRNEPDLFPALCAVAAGHGVTTRFSGLSHLRIKESDRLLALEENLRTLGADCTAGPDWFLLREGNGLRQDGVLLNGFGDHRIVMAMSMLAVKCGFVRVTAAEHVVKSFPGFWDALSGLGFEVQLSP